MPGGRPKDYPDPEVLKEKIQEFFDECDNKTKKALDSRKKLVEIPDPRPYTLTGLKLHIEMSDKEFKRYGEDPDYSDIIKWARLKCENYAEENLFRAKNATGTIFNLKNNYNFIFQV